MSLQAWVAGGNALRVAFFLIGVVYCVRHRGQLRTAMSHVFSIAVLILLIGNHRELATFVGVPTSALIVERLTKLAWLEGRARSAPERGVAVGAGADDLRRHGLR